MTIKRSALALLAVTLLAAACGSDDAASDTTTSDTATTDTATTDTATSETVAATPAPTETDAPTDTAAAAEPVLGPASIAADDQTGDGSTVTVASVDLPTDGFVVIHAEADGSPGPILGWSDLLPAGQSTDVVVSLNEAVGESATVYPMAHVDANGNGVYEFMPPDVTIDVPALTADGDVAVLAISYEVSTTDDEAAPASATAIELASTEVGEFLVDGDGNSLYLFSPDSAGDSTCYDDCEAAWPILGEVADVGDGLDPALLGTTTRTNGDVQATYNGWPLYYFANDAAPGDVNGQGVGDVWYLIDAAGAAITA